MLKDLLVYYGVEQPTPCDNGASVVEGMQHELTIWHHRLTLKRIKEGGRVVDSSRLVAAGAPKASAWMMPPPNGTMHPSDGTMRHAHRMRLGLHLLGGSQERRCECGTILQDLTLFMACSVIKGGSRIRRHDLIVKVVAN